TSRDGKCEYKVTRPIPEAEATSLIDGSVPSAINSWVLRRIVSMFRSASALRFGVEVGTPTPYEASVPVSVTCDYERFACWDEQ
ncbi:MAG: hypothetical protein QOH03_1511, partial [Kribbellaceae bacterium]|nr:hypothetical protein [Kribbellaceae bacterium]